MSRPRSSNSLLRSALFEVGWTEDELARRVNRIAAETGLTLRLDRRSVTHWVAGRRPRRPVPDLVAEALTRGLGRPVTTGDLGLAAEQRAVDTVLVPSGDPLKDIATSLTGLTGARARQSADRTVGVYSLAALQSPPWARARQELMAAGIASMKEPRLEPRQVEATAAMARVFAASDEAFGGGHSRSALAWYLSCDVAPRLRARATPALRSRLLNAATQLVFLCGYMCFDDERHGLAQRYYRLASQLAVVNDDPAAYAFTLRAMSAQAYVLGHHRQALALAEAAVRTGPWISPLGNTLLLGQMAVTAAAVRDRAMAQMALAAAESELMESRSRDVPVTDDHVAALTYQQALVLSLFGHRDGAISALRQSLRARPAAKRRNRALSTACLAELYLSVGRLDEAVAAWQRFLDDYPLLHCGRADTALRTMRSRLRGRSNVPAVRQLLTRADAMRRKHDAPGPTSAPPTIILAR